MLALSTPANQLLAAAVNGNPDPVPTRILVLMNVIDVTDFPGNKDETEYLELARDMEIEATKFGTVTKIVIPRPTKKDLWNTVEYFSFTDNHNDDSMEEEESSEDVPDVPGLGKVFIEYETVEAASAANSALRGRAYDGRMVITSFHLEEKWAIGDLEPDFAEDEELKFSLVTINIAELQQKADLEVNTASKLAEE